jgi:hypothetical protein
MLRLSGSFIKSTSTITCSIKKNLGTSAKLLSTSSFSASDFLGITPQTKMALTLADLGFSYSKNTTYHINLPSGFFNDSQGNPLPAINLDFSTPTFGPTYNSGNPTPGQTNFGNTSVVLAFNRQILQGTSGTVKLYNSSGLVATINATDTTNVTISGSNCTINLITYLKDNTSYYMTIDAGFVTDSLGLPCEAVTANNVIYFTTGPYYTFGPAPATLFYNEDTTEIISPSIQILDYSYSDSTGYTVTITPSDVQGVLSMSSTGGATSSFNNTTKVLTLTGTRTQINANLKNITLIPGGDIRINYTLTYRLTTPRSTVISRTQTVQFGNATQNTKCPSTYSGFNFMTTSSVFSADNYYPMITDPDPTGAQFTVVLTSSNSGMFSTTNLTPRNPITLTGTKSELNTIFHTNQLNYHGLPGATSDTWTYVQTKSTDTSNSTLTNITVAVTLTSNNTHGTILNTWKYLGAGTNTLTLPFDSYYYNLFTIELVGGGGGGAATLAGGVGSGGPSVGGGGGGGYLYHENVSLPGQGLGVYNPPSFTLTVGSGGITGGGAQQSATMPAYSPPAPGSYGGNSTFSYSYNWSPGTNGGNTSFLGYTAYGGAGAGTTVNALNNGSNNQNAPSSGGASGNAGLTANSSTDNHYYNTPGSPSLVANYTEIYNAQNGTSFQPNSLGKGMGGAGVLDSYTTFLQVVSGYNHYNLPDGWLGGKGTNSKLQPQAMVGWGGQGGGPSQGPTAFVGNTIDQNLVIITPNRTSITVNPINIPSYWFSNFPITGRGINNSTNIDFIVDWSADDGTYSVDAQGGVSGRTWANLGFQANDVIRISNYYLSNTGQTGVTYPPGATDYDCVITIIDPTSLAIGGTKFPGVGIFRVQVAGKVAGWKYSYHGRGGNGNAYASTLPMTSGATFQAFLTNPAYGADFTTTLPYDGGPGLAIIQEIKR